jgi:hypothetical protein
MKILSNTRFLTVLYLVMCLGILTACNDDDAVTSDEIQLLSFGPSGVMPGGEISFIGNNLDKVTAVEMTGATVPSTAFTKHTSELITLIAPKETEEGKVILKTASGDIVSKTVLSFEVAVKITTMTETARPGEDITITGDYLNWVKAVRFARDTTVIKFVSQTINKLVVTVPLGAQTGSLIFMTGGTEPLEIESEKELVITLPSLASISPNPAEREKNLTIKGTNLDLVMGVLFKGVTTPVQEFVSKSPAELVVKIPKAATTGQVAIVAYSGINVLSADSLKFVNDPVPTTTK